MRYLKLYESFKSNNNVITVTIDKKLFDNSYWSVYYPAAKIDKEYDNDIDIMDNDEYAYMILDTLSGDIKKYLNNNFEMNIKLNYDKTLMNGSIDLDSLSMNFNTSTSPSFDTLDKLDKFIRSIIRGNIDNAFYTTDKISWSIYMNGAHYKTSVDDDKPAPEKQVYSEYSQPELLRKIDKALDNRDFTEVKRLSSYLDN